VRGKNKEFVIMERDLMLIGVTFVSG